MKIFPLCSESASYVVVTLRFEEAGKDSTNDWTAEVDFRSFNEFVEFTECRLIPGELRSTTMTSPGTVS